MYFFPHKFQVDHIPLGRNFKDRFFILKHIPSLYFRHQYYFKYFFSFFLFSHTFTFQLLDKSWSQVSSLLPPGSCLQFLSRIGFSNPTARRFSSSVAHSRSRAFRKSICAQEKVPTNLYAYALGGARTHETDLYQAMTNVVTFFFMYTKST